MSEWVTDSLSQLVSVQKGRKVQTSDYELPGYVPYLGAGAISGKNDGYASTAQAVVANFNDVLMLWDGERSGLVGRGLNGVVSSTVTKLTPNVKIDSKLLYYLLLFNFEWIQNRRTGTGVPHVPKDLGRILQLCYPLEHESQRRIARILQTIDQAIEKTEALVKKYQHIKAGLMHDLFTRGVGADGQLRPPREQVPELYQHTPVGWIPKEWDTTTLRTACLEISDGAHYSVSRCDEGVPFLFVSCVRNGQILWDNAARISPETYEEISKKSKPYKGMILFTVVGSYGHVAYVPTDDPFGFERNIAYIKPRVDILEPKFLAYWLSSNCVENQVERLVIGNAQKVLTLGNMGKVVIPFLKQKEQKSIVTILESIDVILGCEQKRLDKFADQKSGLMHDLLTGKVQVNAKVSEVDHD